MGKFKHIVPPALILLWETFAFAVSLHYGDTLYDYLWWEFSLAAFLILLALLFTVCYLTGTNIIKRSGLFFGWLTVYSVLTYSLHLEGVALGLFFSPSTEAMKKYHIETRGYPFPDEMYSDIEWGYQGYGTAVRRWQTLRYKHD